MSSWSSRSSDGAMVVGVARTGGRAAVPGYHDAGCCVATVTSGCGPGMDGAGHDRTMARQRHPRGSAYRSPTAQAGVRRRMRDGGSVANVLIASVACVTPTSDAAESSERRNGGDYGACVPTFDVSRASNVPVTRWTAAIPTLGTVNVPVGAAGGSGVMSPRTIPPAPARHRCITRMTDGRNSGMRITSCPRRRRFHHPGANSGCHYACVCSSRGGCGGGPVAEAPGDRAFQGNGSARVSPCP